MTTASISRRTALKLVSAGLATGFSPALFAAQPVPEPATLAQLEPPGGGRLGFCILDTETGKLFGQRLDERFAMCSTFKLALVAAVLQAVDAGRLKLDQLLPYSAADMVPHAPVTTQHLAQGGMTLLALSEAAQTQSDNVAANLLLKCIGGPTGFTAILRGWGDSVTRLDRNEPQMNLVPAGEIRDTTSPRAMAKTAARLLTGDVLRPASRERLLSWMAATATGKKRIRAGLPSDWKAGDKTGTGMAPGMTDKYNDVAIAWPPQHAPLLISAYYDTSRHSQDMRDDDQAVLAAVGRLAARWVRGAP